MTTTPNPVFMEARLIRELGPYYRELAVHITYTEDKAIFWATRDMDVRIPIDETQATTLLEALLAEARREEDTDA